MVSGLTPLFIWANDKHNLSTQQTYQSFHENNTSIKIETRLHSVVVIVHLLSYVLQGTTTVLMKSVFMLQ